MANPKWNISGTLTDSSKAFMNIGGTLTYFSSALENIGGTLTKVWDQNAAATDFWNYAGFTPSALAASTITHECGSGSIANVRISGNTATFTILLKSTRTSIISARPYGPYSEPVNYYNYEFGDFFLNTPNSDASSKISDARFVTSIGTVSSNKYDAVYTSAGAVSYVCAAKLVETKDSSITSNGVSYLSSGVALRISSYGTDNDFSIISTSQTISVALHVLYNGRTALLTNTQSSLVTSPMPTPTSSSVSYGPNQGGPYATTVKHNNYTGTYSFTLSSPARISLSGYKSAYYEHGTIVLADSGGNALCTLISKTENTTSWTTKEYALSAGTYKIQYNWTSLASDGVSKIIPHAYDNA